MNTELFIEGRQADINQDLASLLTLAIEDISYENFGSRQTTFSKSIILPGTARNNLLLGSVFELSVSNPYNPDSANIGINFNASVSANCLLFQDQLQAFKGTIRILKIVIDNGVIDYEVALTGELYRLNIAFTTGLLEDLDFSAYNHTYNTTNIIASWDNAGGSGYYYPLIDYGLYSTIKHDWDIRTFRPALYVKEYIDKMFSAAKFTYDSTLFNTTRFKKLIIPHNQKQLTTLQPYNLVVGPASYAFTNADGTDKLVNMVIHSIVQDYTVNVDSTVFTYTGADFSGVCEADFSGYWKKNSGIPFIIQVVKNGIVIEGATFESSSSSTFIPFHSNVSFAISLTSGDTLSVNVHQGVATSFELDMNAGDAFLKIKTPGGTPVTTNPGDMVKINESVIPKNIKQIDFFTSIIKLFNLYVYEDKFIENLVHITPYVDFYSISSTNAIDWSYKLDRSQPIEIAPLSEISAKTYLFTYKEDSDYYNDLYKKRYNQTYGSYIYDTEFNFIANQQTVDLIFAPTPLIGYAGEDKVYPTILKLTNNTEDRTDSVIRIMQSNKITGVTSWNIKDASTVLTSVTKYGYAGHLNNPDSIDDDLNFGTPLEVFFIMVAADNITTNQFNVYWSSYMAEITDKDSKLLTAKFKLTAQDILNLDFSKYVYIDGSLFRLYKITDYNLTVPDTCEVQLLKVINTLY